MNVLSLFDGISCGQVALQRAGVKVNKYFASEIDKHAIKITQANYPNTVQIGNVINVKATNLPKIDLLIGGSPCQSFSAAGDGRGFNGASGLFYEYARLLEETHPKFFLLENVKMKREWQNIISEILGVEPIEINSKLVSAQNRKRLYWTNIPNICQPPKLDIKINDIIETDKDGKKSKYGLDNIKKIDSSFYEKNDLFFVKGDLMSRQNPLRQYGLSKEKCFTLRCAQNHGVCINGSLRYLLPIECERLQTLPNNYTSSISDNQRIKAIANGWTVDIIKHIFSFIPNRD